MKAAPNFGWSYLASNLVISAIFDDFGTISVSAETIFLSYYYIIEVVLSS